MHKFEKRRSEVSPFIGISSANYFGDVGIMNESVVNPYFVANLDLYFNNRWSLKTGVELQKKGISGGMKEGITPLGIGYKIYINERFSIGIDHQEYVGFANNLKSQYNNNDIFIGNIFGSFSVKAIFKLGSSESE